MGLVAETLPQEKRSEEYVARCYDLIVADYRKNYLVKTRLYDGIADLVSRLKGHSIKLAVFSNKPDDLTKRIVEALAGTQNFEMVLGAQAGMPVKPDPTGALLISAHLGIAPGSILYLGDTDIDMMTANNAGMFAVGALWGFRTKEELLEIEGVQTAAGLTAVYSSRVRTLVNAVYDWSRFNSLPRAYTWIRGELAANRVKVPELVRVTLRYGDKGTIRRIGMLLEAEGVGQALLRRLEQSLKPSTGLIPWIPTKPKRGTINRRWGVVLNGQI